MNKPTIVLLHGVGLDHTMWGPVSALLHDEFEVQAADLPGHGANPPAPTGTTLEDLADQIASLVPPGAHLVGFSLGALVAQHLARYRPDLVASLTSVSSVCRRTPAERQAVLSRLTAAQADFTGSVEASIRRWYDDTGVDQLVVDQTRRTLLANDVDSFLNCYKVFATADAEIGPELPRISVPALAITGELDGGSTPEMSRRLAAAIPSCGVRIVPDARHMLPVQRPSEFVTSITTFIRERGNVTSQSI
jgi:pimeloyl-ACP methyl ester carboxylesterase